MARSHKSILSYENEISINYEKWCLFFKNITLFTCEELLLSSYGIVNSRIKKYIFLLFFIIHCFITAKKYILIRLTSFWHSILFGGDCTQHEAQLSTWQTCKWFGNAKHQCWCLKLNVGSWSWMLRAKHRCCRVKLNVDPEGFESWGLNINVVLWSWMLARKVESWDC